MPALKAMNSSIGIRWLTPKTGSTDPTRQSTSGECSRKLTQIIHIIFNPVKFRSGMCLASDSERKKICKILFFIDFLNGSTMAQIRTAALAMAMRYARERNNPLFVALKQHNFRARGSLPRAGLRPVFQAVYEGLVVSPAILGFAVHALPDLPDARRLHRAIGLLEVEDLVIPFEFEETQHVAQHLFG